MGFKCGIVGLPNVGKSTLFNSLTKAGIAAENYPFCTIDPNVGVVEVPDPRLRQIADIVQPKKVIPTTMEFVDIAGLVAGASKGEGLGNQFLGHIRETDAIAQVVRCFEDEDIAHVSNRIDPLNDIETINTELLLADMESIARQTERAGKLAKSNEKEAKAKYEFMLAVQAHVEDGRQARSLEVQDHQRGWMKELHLITAKPVLYIANVSEDGFENNPHLDVVADYAAKEGAEVVAVCAAIEADIAELEADEAAEFLQESACKPISPRVRRKCAPGPSARAIPRRAPPASFIPTSKKDLSAPKWSALTPLSPATASRAPRMPASGVSKARITSCAKATSCTSVSTSR